MIFIHDLCTELPAHTGMIKKGGAFYRTIDFLNKLSLKYAGGIVVLSERMKQRILDKVPEMNDSVHIIHNLADANRLFPVKKENNGLFEELRLQDKKVVRGRRTKRKKSEIRGQGEGQTSEVGDQMSGGRTDIRRQMSEVGGRRSDVRGEGQKSEVSLEREDREDGKRSAKGMAHRGSA